ncbi:hypothetical protein V6615_00430 [Oscillospiraceae bacterium PP1C4]
MIQLNCIEKYPLPAECCLTYDGMAFDGCNYIFTVCGECVLIKYNLSFCEKECIPTCREYSCICYDTKEKCYWAASRKCYYKIFKLSKCFQEIDFIDVHSCQECGAIITGLSYDCCDDSILVATPICVTRVSKCSEIITVLQESCEEWITGVLSLSPGYIITAINNSTQYIYTYAQNGSLMKMYCTPRDYIVKNIIFNPCEKEKCKDIILYVYAIKKGCYPYMCKVILQPCQLGFIPYDCNYDICHVCCDDHPCHRNPCNDIMESVAQIETAISHILNAEGEKLQKVLATTTDIDKILCVNKEVNNTIINATHLEHVLYAKLSAIEDCCGFCPKDKFDICCDDEFDICPKEKFDICCDDEFDICLDDHNECTCDVDGGVLE